ncbi:MAG: histidinol-phosphatase [Dehalococcoidia bacterium]|nr:histidinol-phosphatase [Dehalococcoidia bacterium]
MVSYLLVMNPLESNLPELLEFAESLADAAEVQILSYFRSQLNIEYKSDLSPVTVADQDAEYAMREIIQTRFPNHGIIGEEYGNLNSSSPWNWVLDPIDGTGAFITGNPLFGTLIGLMHQEEPIIGVINAPLTGERWSAAKGFECRYQYRKNPKTVCKTSKKTDLSKTFLYSTHPSMFDESQTSRLCQIQTKVKNHRFGGDCYLYGMLASGWIDLVIEANMKLFDVMALIPVIQCSGGEISDWDGNQIRSGWDGTVLASSSQKLHQEALKMLQAK